ncbi:MAG: methyltransferase domain-containing protein [Acidobacteria bacterium]|nr:methyltransferase domain-containing protein [Acidobacteriota bacterium]
MTDSNAVFAGSIPENYDRHLGPVLFEPYARDLARRVPAAEGARVLEVACGTGIVTRHLRERLPAASRLVASDLNPPMIDYARRKLQETRGIEWHPADACVLPFPDESFDALVCQFGLMFVPDKPAALREAQRVLSDGGAILLNVWDSLDRNAFAKAAHETIASFFPDDPPTFYQVPFSLHRTDTLEDLLAGAGFSDIRIDPVSLQGESPSARDLATGLVEGNPVGNTIRERGTASVADVVKAVAEALAREFGDRPVRIPLHAFDVTARAGAR